MKRLLTLFLVTLFSTTLISWDFTGHRAVAKIAENHLTAHTKAVLASILNGQTLVDVSTYPDEIKNNPTYNYTARWHYINVPVGLDYNGFKDFVLNDKTPNIYTALIIDINY